jgi:hypothetical protein
VTDEDDRSKQDRQMIELLNELRIALPGVQVLFGFLLTVPFAQGFARVGDFEELVDFGVLLATAGSAACLIAPAAAHRLRFHQRDRAYLIETASNLSIAGLVLLAIAMVGVILLITSFLFGPVAATVATVGMSAVFGGLWFVRPILRGRERR